MDIGKSEHILLFTKSPTPGFAKTRLTPALGPVGAAGVSRRLTETTLRTIRNYVGAHPSCHVFIYYFAPPSLPETAMKEWLQPTSSETLIPQASGDLGDRLTAAFASSFSSGAEKVVVVGADCPAITPDILSVALSSLDSTDVVIGPALDGGYYLLGMKALHKVLFESIPWSTSTVFADTKSAAHSANLTTKSLQALRDIDTPDDLPYFNGSFSKNGA